jgi:AraC family transcriptional regulator
LQPVRTERDGTRIRTLADTADYAAALTYYPAGLRHDEHEHGEAALSFLLSGRFQDHCGGRESSLDGARHVFRPQGARHQCRFGPDGTLILSVHFRTACPPLLHPFQWRASGRDVADLCALLFARAAPAGQLIDDLLAAAGAGSHFPPGCRSGAPRWLRLVAEEIDDDPKVEIATLARRAGVHRVYLTRAFRTHFGASPTQFRLHRKAAAAVRHMVEGGDPPGRAAVAAGFADQAHWTRVSRAIGGFTPARLRRLLEL